MQVSKYDRQIRLWGKKGQKKLGQAKVALLGCSGAGIEAIKNLVLPGVGHIDIWDDGKVSQNDLSSSFFYSPDDIGKYRAQVLVQNLIEMNPDDVKGQAFLLSPNQLIENLDKLKQYSLVIACNLLQQDNIKLSTQCFQNDVGVIFLTVVGFFVYVRNQKKQHFVESSNTAAKKYYMRLHDPFPELQHYSQQWNIQQLVNEIQNASQKLKKTLRQTVDHIPYPIVLMQAYHSLPAQNRKRNDIAAKIRWWQLVIGEDHRASFTQASGRTFDLYQTPDNYLFDPEIFNLPAVVAADQHSHHVLLFLKATGQYLKRTGHLPQSTDLPDMHTSTQIYLNLKKVYKQQHLTDIASIQSIINEITHTVSSLADEDISQMIDNLNSLEVIQFGKYQNQLLQIENPNIAWENAQWRHILLALRAYKLFQQQHKVPPRPQNIDQMIKIVQQKSLISQYGFSELSDHRYFQEICRVQGQTTISISSIGGAVAGQQAIKLITGCFSPVKKGYFYSGIDGKGFSICL